MRSRFAWLAPALLCLGGVAGAQVNAYGTAAKVNGVEISNSALERNFAEYQEDNQINIAAIRYPKRVNEMRREVLEKLIDQEVLWQAAQRAELIASDEDVEEAVQSVRSQFTSEQKFLARLASESFTVDSYRVHMRRVLSANEYAKSFASGIEVSDAEVHDFYVANQPKFQVPEGARARHILLKMSAQADEETQAAIYDAAGKLLERINAGEDFAAIAIAESQDSSAAQGGDLGYFPRGQMVKSFDDAVFALQAGEVSGIVRTPFGLHIIKVEDREDAQMVPEELAKERIVQYLGQVKGDQLIKDEVAALREAASIELLAAQ